MRNILSLAICLAFCSLGEASILKRTDLAIARSIVFENKKLASAEDEYVPLKEQVFPELFNRNRIGSTNAREALLNRLIREQESRNTTVERQKRIYEKIRQQKIRESYRTQSR